MSVERPPLQIGPHSGLAAAAFAALLVAFGGYKEINLSSDDLANFAIGIPGGVLAGVLVSFGDRFTAAWLRMAASLAGGFVGLAADYLCLLGVYAVWRQVDQGSADLFWLCAVAAFGVLILLTAIDLIDERAAHPKGDDP